MSKASEPIFKIGSNEYFRALKGHRSVRLPGQVGNLSIQQYKIDKAVRERLKEGGFGQDSCLENYHNRQGISYDAWCRRKSTEGRIKKKLMINVYEYEWEQELLKRKDKEMRKEEGQKVVHEWCKRKRVENNQKRREKSRQKSVKLREENVKKRDCLLYTSDAADE